MPKWLLMGRCLYELMVGTLGISLIASIPMVLITILIYWFDSSDTVKEREEKLQALVGNESEVAETPKSNEFYVEIEQISVYETESKFYRYVLKPLPIIGGFNGRTEVIATIKGDVLVEEQVLINEVNDREEFIEKIADLRLKGNQLQLALNLVQEEEINEIVTEFRTLILEGGEWIVGDMINEADECVFGNPVVDGNTTQGVARPIVLDVAYPTSRVRSRFYNILRYFLGGIDNMSRGMVWERHDPHRRRKVALVRMRSPTHHSSVMEVTIRDFWHLLNFDTDYSRNVTRLLKIVYMGMGVHRGFASNDGCGIVEVDGSKHLKLYLNQSGEKRLDNLDPDSDVLARHHYSSHFDRVEPPSIEGGEVAVPIFDLNPISHENINPRPRKKGTIEELQACLDLSGGRVVATVLTGLGNGVIQVYYRKQNSYFTVRWNDSHAQVWEVGEVDPEEPLDVEGIVQWHKIHPQRQTAYSGEHQQSIDA